MKIYYWDNYMKSVGISSLTETFQSEPQALSDFLEHGALIYFFDPDELALEEAMDDYAANTTPGGTWICNADPCIPGCDDPTH